MKATGSAWMRMGMRPGAGFVWPAILGVFLLCSTTSCFERDQGGDEAARAPSPQAAKEAAAASKPAEKPGEAAKSAAKSTQTAKPTGSKGAKKGKTTVPAVPPPAVTVVVPAEQLSNEQLKAEVGALRDENERLMASVRSLTPEEPYILINTTLNRLSLKAGDRYLLQDGIVSTGSNTELVEPNGKRSWFFSTPKGVHIVQKKMVAPVWKKPDWAFIEEGEPVPGAQAEARFEEGTLGKYALYFGNGYMIHGTLFQRFLGQSVTHGCVRVGDADLETVYQNAKVGTRIYIY